MLGNQDFKRGKMTLIETLTKQGKAASFELASLSTIRKNEVLNRLAEVIEQQRLALKKANELDIKEAKKKQLASALQDRLYLDDAVIDSMLAGLQQIISLPDPVGKASNFSYQISGILVGKMRVPLGVIAVIYESRPNVTLDAFALCFKAGNSVILRGGSEAIHSNLAIVKCIQEALRLTGVNEHALGFVDQTDRVLVEEILQAVGLIDVIIPRGGKSLVSLITDKARIPVIKHLDGICHIYLDQRLDDHMAVEVTVNAKTSRYGTCNTLETLLVHKKIAAKILPILEQALSAKSVELRGCTQTCHILPQIKKATEEDWKTEYLAPILSVKVVGGVKEAIDHINYYGSHHTDSIITTDYETAQRFIREVDSASVMVNASTRFADGFEYGLGAEIGISTDKIHVRGPVGLLGLTSEKWVVLGNGQIRK